MITSASAVLIPRVTGIFIDSLISSINLGILIKFCILFGVITIISIVSGYFNNYLYVKTSTNILYELKKIIILQFRDSNILEIKKMSIPEVAQMSDRDLDFLISNLLNILQSVIINILLVISSVCILIKINLYISLLLIGIAVIYIVVFLSFRTIITRVNEDFLFDQTKYFKKYFEQFSDIEFVKNNVLKKFYNYRFESIYKKFYLTSMRMQRVNYSFNSIDKICMTIAQIILFFMGGRDVIRGRISVGDFTILSTYFSLALTSVRYFLSLGKLKKEMDVSIDRINKLLNLEKDKDGNIRLDSIDTLDLNLSKEAFFYNTKISNKHLKFVKGKIYVLTGVNGSGKTTLMNIISGLYKFKNVSYQINNISVEQIDMEFNRKYKFSIIEQFPKIAEGSIEENIILGIEPDIISENEKEELISDFGLNSLLGRYIDTEFVSLSGGEIKKIALVRALSKKSEVVLMDEPTVSLDKKSKEILMEYIKKHKKNRIMIITSHDIDLIKLSDEFINI